MCIFYKITVNIVNEIPKPLNRPRCLRMHCSSLNTSPEVLENFHSHYSLYLQICKFNQLPLNSGVGVSISNATTNNIVFHLLKHFFHFWKQIILGGVANLRGLSDFLEPLHSWETFEAACNWVFPFLFTEYQNCRPAVRVVFS